MNGLVVKVHTASDGWEKTEFLMSIFPPQLLLEIALISPIAEFPHSRIPDPGMCSYNLAQILANVKLSDPRYGHGRSALLSSEGKVLHQVAMSEESENVQESTLRMDSCLRHYWGTTRY